jgi:hypothetical protein
MMIGSRFTSDRAAPNLPEPEVSAGTDICDARQHDRVHDVVVQEGVVLRARSPSPLRDPHPDDPFERCESRPDPEDQGEPINSIESR